MLNVYYRPNEGSYFQYGDYFKNRYEDSWITDPFAKEMIRDVDKSEVLGGGVIDSRFSGK